MKVLVMPRSREFEPQQALQKAMTLFWRKGYLDTSLDDLVAETGVSRYGLYGAFGDKQALFLAALDHYRDTVVTHLLGAMEASDGSLADIRRYFTTLLEATSLPIGRLGCLICNTAVELAPLDGPLSGKVAAHLARMTNAFRNALNNARQRGDVPAELDVAAYADYLTGVALGLMTGARASLDRDVLRRFVDVALAALG